MNVNPNMAISKSYSWRLLDISRISDMAARTGKNDSEIARMAVDLLWEKMESETPSTQPPTHPTAQ